LKYYNNNSSIEDIMSGKNKKKGKKDKGQAKDLASAKKKLKDKSPAIVVAKSDDLAEVVTETVTKLLAEDVLDMDDEGIIDLKESVELKKKRKKGKKSE
jgi:hypothetical protein